MDPAVIGEFQKETGISVEGTVLAWDKIHEKIVTAATAQQAFADVSEVDSTWVGEFAQAGWFDPLDNRISQEMSQDMPSIALYQDSGKTIAIPWNLDCRLLEINGLNFSKAGLANKPETWDDVRNQCLTAKSKGINYPLAIALSATAEIGNVWYAMSFSMAGKNGDFFDAQLNPVCNKPDSGPLRALEWIVNAFRSDKLIDPACLTYDSAGMDQLFQTGTSMFALGGPSSYSLDNNPKTSKIAGHVDVAIMPDTHYSSFFTEGIGIPVFSQDKDAAWEFINWYVSPSIAHDLFTKGGGGAPARMSVWQKIASEGAAPPEIADQMKYVGIFQRPRWFTDFVTSMIDAYYSATTGERTPQQAVDYLAAQINKIKAKQP
jgi:multiple sugar transport system substrate-binding protein